jgi:hypothetical protein
MLPRRVQWFRASGQHTGSFVFRGYFVPRLLSPFATALATPSKPESYITIQNLARRTHMSGNIPATSVVFLKETRVEDAFDIELPRKTLTDLSWSMAHCIWVLFDAYPALVPISIGLLCHHKYWPLRRFDYWPLCRFEFSGFHPFLGFDRPCPRKRTLYCRLRPATSVCLFRQSRVEDANRY